MTSTRKTSWLILATLAVAVTALVSSGQQYDPRALTRQNDAPPAQQEYDEFALQWPIVVPSAQGQITIFQPQMENLLGDVLSARAAVSIAQGNSEPVFGVVWFQSRIATDRVSRVVQVLDVNITQTRIPDVDPNTERALSDAVGRAMTQQPMELSLDQLLAMLESANIETAGVTDLAGDAPRIIFVEHPAMKVQYDGEPKLIEVENSPLQRVANTPFFVVLDPGSRMFYLKGGGVWFESRDPMGRFQRASRVPQEVIAAADRFGYQDPQQPLPPDQLQRLEIITATEPTELIWTDGPPQMGTLPGTGLLYMSNTDSDVFMSVDSQRAYVLVSGRWYEAPGRNGPWAFVPPDRLPQDFSRIPPNSPCGDVLAHVAGTPQALEAVADTYVPQTAAVNRLQFEQPAIEYDGDPRFEPVEGAASIRYAVNSPQSVVVVDRRYYACYDAVWYVSDSPRGRWDLCTDVPDVIYTIPPSCPIYPVRYVYVYDSTPEYVYCGYTPGYVGCYVYDGVVVYGTGHHYRPWHGRQFYPRPYTYGFGARYNSYVNHWGFSFGLRTGGGSLWIGYNEESWGRRNPWFGYGGYRPVVVRNDVRRDLFRYDYRNRRDWDRGDRTNITVINEQNTYIRNVNVYQRRNDVRLAEPTRARLAVAERPADRRRAEERNNVLADREGRIYRRTSEGELEVRENRQWRREGRAPAPEVAERRGGAREGGAREGGRGEAQPQLTAAARPVDPDAPRVQRRPPDAIRGADRPVIRTERERPEEPNARGQGAREGRGADQPAARGRQQPEPEQPAARGNGARGRGEDQPEARGAGGRRGPAEPERQSPTLERPTPPPAEAQDRGRGRGAEAQREQREADERNAGGQGNRGERGRAPAATPPPPQRESPTAQEIESANRGDRGRGPVATPPPPQREAPTAQEIEQANRGRGRGAEAQRDQREEDQRNAGGQGNRGDRGRAPAATPPPPQREAPTAQEIEQANRGRAPTATPPPPQRESPTAQEIEQANRGRGRSAEAPPPARPAPAARGEDQGRGDRGRAAETPPPPARGQARGDEADRGPGRSAEPPAPPREGPAARGDQAEPENRGRGRGQERAANPPSQSQPQPPSQRELRQVERDFRARQAAEERLPNYQRRDQASETPRRGRGEDTPARTEPPARGRGEVPPAPGRGENSPTRGRGADPEDENRGRGRGQTL